MLKDGDEGFLVVGIWTGATRWAWDVSPSKEE